MKFLNLLLVFVVVAIAADLLGWSPTLVFVASSLAMIPLAGLMGQVTEALAVHTGPSLGDCSMPNWATLLS